MNYYILFLWTILVCSAFSHNCTSGSTIINNTCQPTTYIQGCFKYLSTNSCKQCQYNYQLINGRCQYQEAKAKDCCKIFNQNGECSECQNGLYLQNGSCLQTKIIGCLQKSRNQCLNCAQKFYLKDSKCLTGISGCIQYSDLGICKVCRSKFHLTNGNCQRIKIFGCLQILNGSCIKCDSPFNLKNQICQIQKCIQMNDFGCAVCDDQYYLKQDAKCYKREIGCQIYQKGVCISCAPFYFLKEQKCLLEGCLNFNAISAQCITCMDNFILQNGICKIQNCFYFKNLKCLICNNGFHLHNGTCLKPLQHCIAAVEEICHECAVGFYLGLDTHCHKFQYGCKNYSKGICIQCNRPYLLTKQSKCIIDGCRQLNSTGCLMCQLPYFLSNKTVQGYYICLLQNCNRASNGVCLQCNLGWHLKRQKCVINDKNCIKYQADGKCTSCINQYFVTENWQCKSANPGCIYTLGKCVDCTNLFKYQNNTCVIQGCQTYNFNDCSNCFEEYYLLNGICIKSLPGCRYVNNTCSSCLDKFMYNNITLKCEIDGCLNYNYRQCLQCQTGYTLNLGKCYLPNCIKSQNGKCKSCSDQFISRLGNCERIDVNCIKYNSDGLCVSCTNNYWLCRLGYCHLSTPGCIYSIDGCTNCLDLFNYDSINKNCTIQGCSKYNLDGCVECFSPYIQVSKICKIPNCKKSFSGKCSTCEQGYHLVNDSCSKDIQGCIKYSEQGLCIQCKDNKYLTNTNICQQKIAGCIYNGGLCTSCISPFVYEENVCKIKGCSKYDFTGCLNCISPFVLSPTKFCYIQNCLKSDNTKCNSCQTGYFLKTDGACQKNTQNCLEYNQKYVCSKCKQNYYLDVSNNCKAKAFGCVYNHGICQSCIQPFILNNNRCIILGCDLYNSTGCIQCLGVTALSNNQTCILDHCNKICPLHFKCLNCDDGYQLTEVGRCKRFIQNCSIIDGDICKSCIQGSHLSINSDKCIKNAIGCLYTKQLCTSCITPFTYQNNACKIEGCLTYGNSGCLQCINNYFILTNGICTILNCQIIKNNTCLKCQSGFNLANGQCIKDIKVTNSGDQKCSKCSNSIDFDQQKNINQNDYSSKASIYIKNNHLSNHKNLHNIQSGSASSNIINVNNVDLNNQQDQEYDQGYGYSSENMRNGGILGISKVKNVGINLNNNLNTGNSLRVGNQLNLGSTINIKNPKLVGYTNNYQSGNAHSTNWDDSYDYDNSMKIYQSYSNSTQLTDHPFNITSLKVASKFARMVYSSIDTKISSHSSNSLLTYWRASSTVGKQFTGFQMDNAVYFYCLAISGSKFGYLRSFTLQYSLDGISFITTNVMFDSTQTKNGGIIYFRFSPIYAKLIRIVVQEYEIDLAFSYEFYFSSQIIELSFLDSGDEISRRVISSLENRLRNHKIRTQTQTSYNIQTYDEYQLQPQRDCSTSNTNCWIGQEFSAPINITSIQFVYNKAGNGTIKQFYIEYLADQNKNYTCYQKCTHIKLPDCGKYILDSALLVRKIRIHPVTWIGCPHIKIKYN